MSMAREGAWALAILALTCLGGISGTATARADETALIGQAGAALLPDGDVVFRSRRYDLGFVADGKGGRSPVLIDGLVVTKQSVVNPADVSVSGSMVSLSVRKVEAGKGFGPPLAEVRIPGDGFTLADEDEIDVTLFGCCAINDAITALHLPDLGVISVWSNDLPLLTATLTDGKSATGRTLGIYKIGAALDRLVLPAPDVAAILTWADDAHPLQRVALHDKAAKLAEAAANWNITPGWNSAGPDADTHVVIDKAKPRPLHFRWQLDDKREIDIPLVGDRLDLANATMPPGFTLENLPVR